MLGSVPDLGTIIVADLEAGIGTLTRLAEAAVDYTLVVVEPTPRSIDVGRRALAAATDNQQGRVIVVGNKVADEDDRTVLESAFAGEQIVMIPSDSAIVESDRQGVSPVDHNPNSPAVTAIETIVDLLDLDVVCS